MKITHPEKIYFPKGKVTKKHVVDFYRKIWKRLRPLAKNHPFIMQRFPEGIEEEGFFQKNAGDYFPDWIQTVHVQKKGKGSNNLVLCNSLKTLTYLVNQGVITPHLWLSQTPKLDKPDRMIFDIDPPSSKGFSNVIKIAKELRVFLEKELKLKSYVMTTGSRGLHVWVFLQAKHSFDEVRRFAKQITEILAERNPKICTTKTRKEQRKGKIYLDAFRNSFGQHAVAPYALRPLPNASIAMPIDWKTLDKRDFKPDAFTLKSFRLPQKNPWASPKKHALTTAMNRLEKILHDKSS